MRLMINYVLALLLYENFFFSFHYVKCFKRRCVVFICLIYFENTLSFVIKITRCDSVKL